VTRATADGLVIETHPYN